MPPAPPLQREDPARLSWSRSPSNALAPQELLIRGVSCGQLQHGPCPAPAAGAGELPRDVLSCSIPPGPGFPHPTQTVYARSPGLSLSLGWSTTSMHRDMLPLPASPSHPPKIGTILPAVPRDVCSPTSVPAVYPTAAHSACRIQPACSSLAA